MRVLTSAVLAATMILCLGFLLNASHAQGTPDLLQWYVMVSSSACKEAWLCSNCDWSSTPCTNFTVPTTGSYNLYASVRCPPDIHCGHCKSCARIFQGDSLLQRAESHCGDEAACTGSVTGFNLTAGTTYRLCVCKIPCQRDSSHCGDCDTACVAEACVTATFGGGGCN